ncbi:MAG: tol-pal system protein YbgF [Hyphomonadaceae bacterium]
MNERPVSSGRSRLAVIIAAAGFAFALPAAAQTQLPPPAAYAPADARQDRIEELEAQLRDATAENERVQYQLMQANREITRLRAMVGELSAVNDSAVQSLQNPDAQPGEEVVRPQGDQRSSVAPSPSGAPAPSGLNAAQQRATGTLGSISETALPAPPQPVRDAADDYSRARELLNNGELAEAEVAFADFLQRYPDESTSADARYWYAFTLLARNNHADAAANFVTYLQGNAQGPRAPEAQVRLGMALAGMGQQRQACGAFGQLTRRYPNASRSVRDLAAREARAANCAA